MLVYWAPLVKPHKVDFSCCLRLRRRNCTLNTRHRTLTHTVQCKEEWSSRDFVVQFTLCRLDGSLIETVPSIFSRVLSCRSSILCVCVCVCVACHSEHWYFQDTECRAYYRCLKLCWQDLPGDPVSHSVTGFTSKMAVVSEKERKAHLPLGKCAFHFFPSLFI